MIMYSETWKFYKVLCSFVILWCCMIRANGNTATNDLLTVKGADPSSNLLKIILDIPNETGRNPSNPMLPMNINVGSINFNFPINSSDLNTNRIAYKTQTNNVRDDYILTEGIGYHKFHTRKLNWNNARKACIDENAHLAVINSVKEEKALRQLMTENGGVQEAYIGAHDLFQEGDWVTITGESLEKAGFNLWSNLWPDEPDNSAGDQNCAALRIEGGMDDVECNLNLYYICELSV